MIRQLTALARLSRRASGMLLHRKIDNREATSRSPRYAAPRFAPQDPIHAQQEVGIDECVRAN